MNENLKKFMAAKDVAWVNYWAAQERTNDALWADLRAAQANYRAAVEAEKNNASTSVDE